MPAWLPTAIASGASLLGGLFGAQQRRKTSKENVRKEIAARKELAKYQFEQNKEMWNEMKKYNAPKAQMSRFKEAGLNPHLIYGQGTPGNVSQYPQYQAPNIDYNVEPFDPSSAINQGISTYRNMRMNQAQVDNVQQMTEKAQADENLARQRQLLINTQDALNSQELQKQSLVLGEIMKYPQKYAEASLQKYLAEVGEQTARKIGQELKNEYQKEVNKWAKRGMSLNDQLQYRALIGIFENLGLDTSWLNINNK